MPALSSLYHSMSIQVSCMLDRRNWGETGGGAVGTSKWHFTNIEKITGIDIRQSNMPIPEFLDPLSPCHTYYHLPCNV